MRRRKDRIGYGSGKVPQPLGMPQTAERLAVAEGTGALGRELTKDESKVAISVAHLFSSHIMSLDEQIAMLEAKLLEIHRRWA